MTFLAGTVENQKPTLIQLEASFKRKINWSKYQCKKLEQAKDRYIDFLLDPNLEEVNRLFCFII